MLVPVKTSNGLAFRQTQLKELLAEVDSFQGEPTEDDIRRLARKYGDTEGFVRSCFETRIYRHGTKWREFRERARKAAENRGHRGMWEPRELEYIKRHWEEMSDEELAEGLNSLPGQRRRRTAEAVTKKRHQMGLNRKRGRPSARHKK